MASVLLSNPIYQHSGETEKQASLAQQASVNEDQEQRRRQLDQTGEHHKQLLAKEVSHLVDQFGGNVNLKSTPYELPSKPITETASGLLSSALEAGKSMLNTASSVASSTLATASSITSSALDTATHLGYDAAAKANSLAHVAADQASSLAHVAADQASSLAHVAKDQASVLASKAVLTSSALTQKTREVAAAANEKAHEIADNIGNFTTLVAVLAEEENERARRMVSGDEALAAANAFKISELVRGLGDSFYKQQSPNLLYKTKVLEEAERRWRLNSSSSELIEKNAHREGKLVRKNLQDFARAPTISRKSIRALEEKERTRRMTDPAEAWAIINGLNLSFIIRDLGLGFYRQEGTFSRTHAAYATTLLEENERRDRIRTHNLLHATEQHSLISDVISNNLDKFNFTTRNAAKYANEFASILGNATMRITSQFSSLTKEFASSAAERVKSVAGDLRNYSTIMYVVALEERERARRLSDADEISAINNAWFQSQLIRDLSSLYKPSSSLARYPLGLIEAQERAWRIAEINPSASRKLSAIVLANSQKFESAMQSAADKERARADQIAQSRLNPRAAAFVPHAAKVEPAPIAQEFRAAGAQL